MAETKKFIYGKLYFFKVNNPFFKFKSRTGYCAQIKMIFFIKKLNLKTTKVINEFLNKK